MGGGVVVCMGRSGAVHAPARDALAPWKSRSKWLEAKKKGKKISC